jgi:hypothetical protein
VTQNARVITTAARDVGSCLESTHRGQELDVGEWMSIREAATLLEISASTVLRSLTNETRRAKEWGTEGEGWRIKPLSERGDYQLRRSWVERKASPSR